MTEQDQTEVEAEVTDQAVIPAEDENAESSTAEANDSRDQNVDGEDTTAKPKSKGVQKRIDELVRQRSDVERDRDYWRELATKSQQTPEPEPEQKTVDIPPMPREIEFDSHEEYQKAVAERDAKLLDLAVSKVEEKQQQQQQTATVSERQAKFNEAVDKLSETHPDAKALIYGRDSAAISENMAEALFGVSNSAEVAYELTSNPGEAYRISTLPPVEQHIEIGKLSERIKLPKPKTLSQAPDPIKPVGGGGEPAKVDPDKLSIDDWMEKRRAGEI